MIKYMKIKKIETIVVILWFREESKRKKMEENQISIEWELAYKRVGYYSLYSWLQK